MSVGVITRRRNFHWESASKPALNRCAGGYRVSSLGHHHSHHQDRSQASPLPHLHQHTHYPCPHHHHRRHHHHHTPRRRAFSHNETPPWPSRRSSEPSPPSIATSWTTDTSSLLTADSLSLSGGASSSSTLSVETPSALVPKPSSFVKRMSSTGASRSSQQEVNGGTSTAAAREVKQYLNRTLFPRPSSTLHGYASLYHRLKKLPVTHRKARQRGKTQTQLGSGATPASGTSTGLTPQDEQSASDLEDVSSIEDVVPSPPRVEIHIYVPTAAAQNSQQEEDAAIAF